MIGVIKKMSERIQTLAAGGFTLRWEPIPTVQSKRWGLAGGKKGPSRSSRTVFILGEQYILKVGQQSAHEAERWQKIKDSKDSGLFVPVLEHGITSKSETPWCLQPFIRFKKNVHVTEYDRIGKAFVYDITSEFNIHDIGPGANWGLEVGTGRALVYDYAL